MDRRLGFLALIVTLTACSSLPPNRLRESHPGPLQQRFRQTHDPATFDYAACEPFDDGSAGVTEIAIERTPCYGFCPTYTLRLRSDGTVEYVGQASVRFVGTRHGTIDPFFFMQLARAAIGIGFFELKDRYATCVTDSPTVYVAVTRNGQSKIVQHYDPESSGPQALRLLEEAIDATQRYVDWSNE